ncbi:MAG: beta-galactosidase [Kiritimatiellae bacterium]|nr:beta-galactosidase [Kiritimatiellia bacterium]
MKRVMVGCAVAFLTVSVFADVVLFDAATTSADVIRAQDQATVNLADGVLRVKTPKSQSYPGACIRGKWDLTGCNIVEVELDKAYGGSWPMRLRLLNPGGNAGARKDSYVNVFRTDGKKTVFANFLPPRMPEWHKIVKKLTVVRTWALPFAVFPSFDSSGVEWERKISFSDLDPSKVTEVAVYYNAPLEPHEFGIRRIVAKSGKSLEVAEFARKTVEEFFPFIDRYGQFKWKEWPDKVHTDADLQKMREKEAADLAAHPGPKGWNKYGGWLGGPQLNATGAFRVEKVNGKWWMVDPDGRLWWSHGPVRVTPSSAVTPLDRHEDWFESLPAADSPFAKFYTTRDELLWPYYVKRNIQRTYDFSAANICRKYGEKWFDAYADISHRRLLSWGCNTIANSSDKRICLLDRTPYIDRFELKSRPLVDKGGWWPFRDPFDPSFRQNVRDNMKEHKAEMDDPWCFGFFVDNELKWGNEGDLARWTLEGPADLCAKREFRNRLQKKYGDIDALNRAWWNGEKVYADWDAFLSVSKVPGKAANSDLHDFSCEVADAYYRGIREEFKKLAPNKLYMGCRYAGGAKEFILRAAAKYCDVISFNRYAKEISGFKLPAGIDKPVIIGEFHFGALDRGPFCPGLILLKDQNERAAVYKQYVRSALENPLIVGVHWHQYSDQATSGRFDGENMQVGWTDVCDTPYWETIRAIREIGYPMYEIRWQAK